MCQCTVCLPSRSIMQQLLLLLLLLLVYAVNHMLCKCALAD